MLGGMTTPRALVVNGTVGSGKTTTIEHVGDLLAEAGRPHALVDLDWLRKGWPPPLDDAFNSELELTNLRAVTAGFHAAGMTDLVLAGVIEDPALLPRYAQALGCAPTVVRLRVDLDWLRDRLAARHADDTEAREWHQRRCGELHAILEQTRSREHVVDVAPGEAPRQVAVRVLQAAGWMAR